MVSFFCGALGILLLARALRHVPNVRPSPRFLVGLASVTLVWTVIVIGTLAVASQIGVWGLLERIATALYLLWVLIVSLGLWRSPSLERTPEQSVLPYSPGEIVAQAVARVLERPRRALVVPASWRLMLLGVRFFPAIVDRLFGSAQGQARIHASG